MIYTENYQLRKPVIGVDDADVNDLNYNSDRIDAIMHSSQISLADAYDLNSTYNTGDVVMYEFLMYRCLEDNVTGVWNPEKWTRTTAGEESGGGADLDIYGEASGTAEASFSDGAEASLVECEIGIVPSQDLHGYSKPWAGGDWKNKITLTVDGIKTASGAAGWADNQKEVSGVTFTILTDSANNVIGIKADGTATAQITFSINPSQTLTEGDYLSGCEDGANDTYGIGISQIGIVQTTTDHAITSGEASTNRNFYIRIMSGVQVNNVIFYPMLRASTAQSGFEPYSNICPISGHTDVTVTVAITSGGSGDDTTIALGRTVYFGTLDVTTGKLDVTCKLLTINTAISKRDNNSFRLTTAISDMLLDNSDTQLPDNRFICDKYEFKTIRDVVTNTLVGIAVSSTSSGLYLYGDNMASMTLEQAQTYLSSNPINVVYVLDTPQTFYLTPTQVKTLLGQNYVSHDGGGTISLIYIKKDSTIIPNPSDAEVPLTGLEISGKDFVITDARIPAPPTTNGAYVLTVTVSGGTPTYSWENA